MKNGVLALVIVVVFLGMTGLAQTQDSDLHGSVGVTYDTKYIWRGFDVFGSKTAIHPFIDLNLFNTGLGLSVTGHRANASGFELSERWDYALYYQNSLYESEPYATNYRVSWIYYNYPDLSSHTRDSADLQEAQLLLSWPQLLGIKGLVPSYVLVKLWPSNSDSPVGAGNPYGGTASGFAHIFMLDYGWAVPGFTSDTPQQILNLHSEVVFNDGVDPRPYGSYTSSDWTNAVFGISTDFNLGSNVILTPGLNYQITMEDNGDRGIYGNGVSPDHDILWASLTLKCKF